MSDLQATISRPDIQSLPNEVLLIVFDYVEKTPSLRSVAVTNKRFHGLVIDRLWRRVDDKNVNCLLWILLDSNRTKDAEDSKERYERYKRYVQSVREIRLYKELLVRVIGCYSTDDNPLFPSLKHVEISLKPEHDGDYVREGLPLLQKGVKSVCVYIQKPCSTFGDYQNPEGIVIAELVKKIPELKKLKIIRDERRYSMDLPRIPINKELEGPLSNMGSLVSVTLSASYLNGPTYVTLSGLPNLEKISISYEPTISSYADFDYSNPVTDLKSRIGSAVFPKLSKFCFLTTLQDLNEFLEEDDFHFWGQLIYFTACLPHAASASFLEECLIKLNKKCPNLELLSFGWIGPGLTDTFSQDLLTSSKEFTMKAFEPITSMINLKHLYIERGLVFGAICDAEFMETIKKCPRLTGLSFIADGARFTPSCLPLLAEACSNLLHLRIKIYLDGNGSVPTLNEPFAKKGFIMKEEIIREFTP